MIDKSIIDQVIQATDIVEVISEYVQLTKKGTSFVGLCPFHADKNPSMSVSGEKKVFNCFSCNTKGTVIYFVSKFEGISMDQATIKLAKRAGIKVEENVRKEDERNSRLYKIMEDATNFYSFYLQNTEEGKSALKYLEQRGLGSAEIEKYRIGLAPKAKNFLATTLEKNGFSPLDQIELGLIRREKDDIFDSFRSRIMFPIENRYGQVVGFSGRIYEKSDLPKYVNSSENVIFKKGEILYNFKRASLYAKQLNRLFIFEGFMDIIAVEKCGLLNGVATMGTALTKEHVRMILSVTKNITLFFDGDEAGINALRRSAEMFANQNIIPDAVVLPSKMDPDEYITKYGQEKFNDYVLNNQKNVYDCLFALLKENLKTDDVVSLDRFKNEVLQLIKASKNEIVENHLLSKLNEVTNLDISELKKDLRTIRKTLKSTPNKQQVVRKTLKSNNIPKKVIRAYDMVIKSSINSKEKFVDFFAKIENEGLIPYPGKMLNLQYEILHIILAFYGENLNSEGIGKELIMTLLATDEQKNEVLRVLNDEFLDEFNNTLFDDSVSVIVEFFEKFKSIAIYNAVVSSSTKEEQDIYNKKYIEISRLKKKIINGED